MSIKDNTYGIAPLQQKMLDILKYLISVCEENNLTYWLGGGSCLGALRHEGFIPWDDDLDVYMPRDDYEKLWNLKKDIVDGHYKLVRTTKNKNYRHRVMQIVDVDTTFINKRCINDDIEHGVYIDILPIDARAKSKIGRVLQAFNAMLFSVYNIQITPEFYGGGLQNTVIKLMLLLVKNPDRRFAIWTKAEKRMSKYAWDESDDLIVLTSILKELWWSRPKEWFGKRYVQFEDIIACIPSGAEQYCTQFYGDYMQLPPVEKRHPIHNTVFIDLDNPYVKYKGIHYCVDKH